MVRLAQRRVSSVSQGLTKMVANAAYTTAMDGSSIHCHGPCQTLPPISTRVTRHRAALRSQLYQRLGSRRSGRRPRTASVPNTIRALRIETSRSTQEMISQGMVSIPL